MTKNFFAKRKLITLNSRMEKHKIFEKKFFFDQTLPLISLNLLNYFCVTSEFTSALLYNNCLNG